MSVMTVERGANAGVFAGAVAAMAGATVLASAALYLVASRDQPASQSEAKPKPVVVKPVKAAAPVAAFPPAPVPKIAPHAEWMDRALKANP